MHGNNITYVGQSKNIVKRVGQHLEDKTKEFSHYTWIPAKNKAQRLATEAYYIAYIRSCKQPTKLRNK